FLNPSSFFFSSRRRHTSFSRDWIQTCALPISSLDLAFSHATPTPEPDVPYYGYGWRINGDAVWHSGESIGFRNVIVRYPKEKLRSEERRVGKEGRAWRSPCRQMAHCETTCATA